MTDATARRPLLWGAGIPSRRHVTRLGRFVTVSTAFLIGLAFWWLNAAPTEPATPADGTGITAWAAFWIAAFGLGAVWAVRQYLIRPVAGILAQAPDRQVAGQQLLTVLRTALPWGVTLSPAMILLGIDAGSPWEILQILALIVAWHLVDRPLLSALDRALPVRPA